MTWATLLDAAPPAEETLLPSPYYHGRMVNRGWGEPESQLLERHDASDFETKTQDKVAAKTA